ncbi:mucin-5AC-like isoform X1 [Haliotis rufescens]|uniref:mucin-5AC-like isoform X1 n=1 Tax=Haliotis rufescens TaxID=6454 RepID=UPI00201F2097|nr:mucin-5AC-like isoform X1 [Haliotis rufescens]
MSMSITCLRFAILTCLSVTLSGNSVDLNTTLSSVPTLASSQDTSLSPRTDAQSTIHPTRPLNVTEVTSTLGYTQLIGNRMTPITKSSVTADATISEETDEMSSATPTAATPKSTATTSLTSTKLTSTTTTESPSTTSPSTTHSTTASSPTSAPGINIIRIKGKRKKLSLEDIANSASTTTIANKPANKKTNRKKRKPRKMQSPKQNENPRSNSKKSSRGTQSKKKPATPTTPTATSLHGARTTAAPLSPDATIRVHTIDTGVKPVAFAAAAAGKQYKKKNAGKGKKGSRKANKAQGKKGDKGPAGPPGPKGAKGEPGAAQASMAMQAASSSVLTEHFGPDTDVIVPFDLKLIDLADNYDNTTGVFICTIPGVYVISLYLMSHPGAKVNARIFINSRPIAALWADDSKNSGFYPSSSIQTISRLEFGDQVYVMLVDGGYGESWVHANYNAFTLFLLYEEIFFK